MASDSFPPEPSQYHVLENFSPMEADNVNDLVKILSMNELLRNIPLTSTITYENGIVPETLSNKFFELNISTPYIDVTGGLCIHAAEANTGLGHGANKGQPYYSQSGKRFTG